MSISMQSYIQYKKVQQNHFHSYCLHFRQSSQDSTTQKASGTCSNNCTGCQSNSLFWVVHFKHYNGGEIT